MATSTRGFQEGGRADRVVDGGVEVREAGRHRSRQEGHAEDDDGSRGEQDPEQRAPPRARHLAGREQEEDQRDRHEHQREGGLPHPRGGPRERQVDALVEGERRVRTTGLRERDSQPDPREQQTDPIAGPA